MLATLNTFHLERSPLKAIAQMNIRVMSVTLDTSHLERSALNDVAHSNIPDMSVTSDTTHFEMSPLNLVVPEESGACALNAPFMSVTPETSQYAMAPSRPLEQSKSEASMHFSMAALSSAIDLGAQAVRVSPKSGLGFRV